MIALLLACRPDPTCTPTPVEPAEAAFAAILSDFTVGGLAFGDGHGRVGEPVLAVSGDALVRPVDGVVYVVERGTVDAVTAIDPQAPTVPLWQTALPPGANAHDLVGFDGRLWIPCQGIPEVLVLDPGDGEIVQRVDLVNLAVPSDGNPDLDAAVVLQGRLFVAAQQLWDDPAVQGILYESDAGLLVELDRTGAVVAAFQVGPNPRILPASDSEIAVMTGLFQFPGADAARADDDALRLFDVETASLGPEVVAGQGEDFFDAVVAGGQLVLLTVDAEPASRVRCVDLDTSEVQEAAFATGNWSYTAAGLPALVVVGDRAQPGGDFGASTHALDPATCVPVASGPECATLDPYDFAPL